MTSKEYVRKIYPTAKAEWFLVACVKARFVIVSYVTENGQNMFLDSDNKSETKAWNNSKKLIQKMFLAGLES